MKKLILITVLITASLGLAGCPASETGNTAVNNTVNSSPANGNRTVSNSAAPANAATSGTPAATMSKEDADKERSVTLADIDAGKPMTDAELKEKFTANPADWKGKKVAVRGKLAMYMTSSSVLDNSSAYRTQLKDNKGQPTVACISKERPKEWEATQNRKDFSKDVYFVFKGVVRDINLDHVALEPCEVVSMKEE